MSDTNRDTDSGTSKRSAINERYIIDLGAHGICHQTYVAALIAERDEARTAVETLLEWAERYRGGDPTLDAEEWYVSSEYARRVLARAALSREPAAGFRYDASGKCLDCGGIGGCHSLHCSGVPAAAQTPEETP